LLQKRQIAVRGCPIRATGNPRSGTFEWGCAVWLGTHLTLPRPNFGTLGLPQISAYTRGIRWGVADMNPVPASEPPVSKKKEGIALTTQQLNLLFNTVAAPWGLDTYLELDAALRLRSPRAIRALPARAGHTIETVRLRA
jgi:hypothetical protein